MFIDYLDTPLGLFEFMATDKGICQAIFCGDKAPDDKLKNSQKNANSSQSGNDITALCKQQLTEYFNGQRQVFTVPLDSKGTPFQQSVWHCLTQIPFGAVKSYGEIAKMINNPKASQAVGGANGRNPISIIVPCHRVIGGDGSLTGYAGGVERKSWLLNHEGVFMKNSVNHNAKVALQNLPSEYEQLNIDNVIHKRQAKTQYLL